MSPTIMAVPTSTDTQQNNLAAICPHVSENNGELQSNVQTTTQNEVWGQRIDETLYYARTLNFTLIEDRMLESAGNLLGGTTNIRNAQVDLALPVKHPQGLTPATNLVHCFMSCTRDDSTSP